MTLPLVYLSTCLLVYSSTKYFNFSAKRYFSVSNMELTFLTLSKMLTLGNDYASLPLLLLNRIFLL